LDDLIIPLSHACTLVALNYIALKIRNRLFIESYEWFFVPILTGIASIIMMLQPVSKDYMPIDLRSAPIIMAGLRFGWGISILSIILPSAFGILTEEGHFVRQLIVDMLMPAIISSSFRRPEYDNGYSGIRFMDGVKICAILSLTRAIVLYYESPPSSFMFYISQLLTFLLSTASIIVLIYMFNDENKNWLLHRQLELQANQDSLTKLPNTRSFLNIAKSTLKRRRISIFMIDVDNFKMFNDTYGHLIGDLLLRHVGQLLRVSIEEHDYVARYGGEEFIIMSLVTDEEQLAEYAKRLCDKIASTPFSDPESGLKTDKPMVTISIGLSTARRTNDELQRIISEADEALYVSKRTGKNKFSFYSALDNQTKTNNA
jgi:diguanylate cyclase